MGFLLIIIILVIAVPVIFIAGVVSIISRAGKVAVLERRIHELEKTSKTQESTPLDTVDSVSRQESGTQQSIQKNEQQEDDNGQSADLEHTIGGNIFTKVGVVALLFGIAFLFNYAYQNEWIGPVGWVTLGVIVSALFIGIGEVLRMRYQGYAHTLTGGGFAILFLSLWAMGPAFYNLVSQELTFICLLFATIFAVFLAIRVNALVLMIMGVSGGFLTPFLAQGGFGDYIFLFGYLALLNIGILMLSVWRHWKELIFVGIVGTTIIFSTWYSTYYTQNLMALTELFAIIFLVIFSLAPVFHSFFTRTKVDAGDIALIFVPPFLYYSFTYQLLAPIGYKYAGVAAIGVALWHLLLFFFGYFINKEDKGLLYSLGFLVITFFNIWIAVALEGSIITLLMLLEAGALIFIAFQLVDAFTYYLRIIGLALGVIGVVRLITVDMIRFDIALFIPLFNGLFFNFVIATAIFAFIGILYRKYAAFLLPQEQNIAVVVFVTANLIFFTGCNVQVWQYFAREQLAINNARIAATQIVETPSAYRDRYGRPLQPQRSFTIAPADQQKYSASMAALKSRRNLSFSVLWMLYAATALIVGIIFHASIIRIFALGLFGITIVKIFLIDMAALEGIYRILSFISLGVLLIISGFLYQKYKERMHLLT